jgi:hypothetical protein
MMDPMFFVTMVAMWRIAVSTFFCGFAWPPGGPPAK